MTKQKKLNPHKALLIERSIEAKELIKIRVAHAETEQEKIIAACLRVNDILMEKHIKESGQTEFKTFHDWKKEGFKVKKGENAFRIWGKPRQCKKSIDAVDVKTNEEKTIEEKYKLYPMCCLFHRGQVEPLDAKPVPESEPKTETVESNPEPITTEPAPQEQPQEPVEAIDSPFVCSDFEGKQEARSDRLSERAAKKKAESNAQSQRSRELVEHIPMGQPILVGHHSEARHRKTLAKSWDAIGKSVALDDYANSLSSRAASVGTGGIATDDPEALKKLTEKLESLVKSQELMKLVNKQFRAGGWDAITAISEGQVKALRDHFQSYERKPFARYALSNNSAEIRRIKQRIDGLKQLYKMEPIDFDNDDFKMYVDDGRIRIKFHGGKPSQEVRTLVHKGYRFNFSRYQNNEWVRKATVNAIRSAELLLEELKTKEKIYD